MNAFPPNEPLTDAEFDRLGRFLESCKGGRAMNVEQLDGFFAALIAGPEMVNAERVPAGGFRWGRIRDLPICQSRRSQRRLRADEAALEHKRRLPAQWRGVYSIFIGGRNGRHPWQRLGTRIQEGHGHASRWMGHA